MVDSWTTRLALYVSLTKPRLVSLVMVTVAVSFLLGLREGGSGSAGMIWATLIGTALVAGGAGALNQWLERDRDGLMRRTAGRALPSGRITSAEAITVGVLLGAIGSGILYFGTNALAAGVAVVTYVLYVFVYTPLKTRTSLNTVIGAIPGALPAVIGWTAATGRMGIEAWALFLIVFLWQFPHFLAIAWIYRDDYRRAGFMMLSGDDPLGRRTGSQSVSYALALLPAGLLPVTLLLGGAFYFAGAFLLGTYYLVEAVRFSRDVSDMRARRLLRASFVYLPVILLLLLLNPTHY
jgi:protoheme IX farnesyltransferase